MSTLLALFLASLVFLVVGLGICQATDTPFSPYRKWAPTVGANLMGLGILLFVVSGGGLLVQSATQAHRDIKECVAHEIKVNKLHPRAAQNRCWGDD